MSKTGKTTIEALTAPPPQEIIQDLQSDKGEVTARGARIQTLEQLIRAAKIDLKVWEVERHVINKWEVGRKDRSVKLDYVEGAATGSVHDSGTIHVEPLWQVKVWLRRREPKIQAAFDLLEAIRKGAPLWPKVKRPAVFRGVNPGPLRSLEICIMDPHLGMVCAPPEADGPWDLEIAAGMIFQAMDDLIAIAAPYGPFAGVFMPFGNDFVHVDNVFHTTTAGTGQPEALSWHRVYGEAQRVAIGMVERARQVAPVNVYQIPGNHSRQTDFTLGKLLEAVFANAKDVTVDASSSPYKFHRCGCNLIGYEHGHSVKPIRLAALMANERRQDWSETEYREWHLGDQHRKGSSKPSMLEEQGVSVEYIPGLTAPNEWHRLKSFSHQQRGAMAFVWDHEAGPLARFQWNVSKYTHLPMQGRSKKEEVRSKKVRKAK